MSTLDLILIIPLAIGAYSGFKEGFLNELFSILAFIIGLLAAFKLFHAGVDLLRDSFDLEGAWLPMISFIIIFIGVVILTRLIGKVLKNAVHATLLGPVDKIAGAILAIFKWGLGISVVLWIVDTFGLTLPESWTEDSLIYPDLRPMSEKLMEWISVILPWATDLFESIRSQLAI